MREVFHRRGTSVKRLDNISGQRCLSGFRRCSASTSTSRSQDSVASLLHRSVAPFAWLSGLDALTTSTVEYKLEFYDL